MRKFEICKGFESTAIMPNRSTKFSAGYDFYAAEDCVFNPKEVKIVHTGIKTMMSNNEVLLLHIRSSMAMKGLMLGNGVGVVDSDYYNNKDNEGEIGFIVYNSTDNVQEIKKGQKFGQGIFMEYKIAYNETTTDEIREGGFGSTGEK